ncbi:MAG: BREX-1 system phosphatase PglZ type A, partial [Synergistaceae bacterium]|jgi:uncharacterized protein (TIGR02687 family)|nr:BREX-1 system phosphatase PglZ type A [Synergistaceae bacterium]
VAEFEKYGLLPAFWRLCEETLGYADAAPSVERLAVTLFVTCAAKQLRGDAPQAWQAFVSYKSGSVVAFLDNLMNNVLYREKYNELAARVSEILNAREALGAYAPEALLECDAFALCDEFILRWICERLLDEDTGAALGGLDIPAVCELRKKKRFGERCAGRYDMLAAAHGIVRAAKANYSCPECFADIVRRYVEADYRIDGLYRAFYTEFDRTADAEEYERLRDLVENIYTNEYLGKLLPAWNAALDVKTAISGENAQPRFFNDRVKHAKEKTAVIVSDALRYEVGRELFDKLSDDPNCDAEMNYLTGALPTYTQLGMAALLPHKTLEILPDGKVLADGQPSDSLERREAILRSALPKSRCVRADSLPAKRDELREIFNGMDAVYIYHDQIDARGGKAAMENEVFTACSEAVEEIRALIKRLSGSANVYRFIVTADHGFLYKRDRFTESEKIDLDGMKDAFVNRRFVIAETAVRADGVRFAPLSDAVGGEDARMLSWPAGANVFRTQGGLCFTHGGASPQEMILPLILVKTEKGHVETRPAKIALVSVVQKITNLITQLEFIQQEPVSDVVRAAAYKLYFLSEENEKISNECLFQADRKDGDSGKRTFRLRFSFKNKKYDAAKKYWLVAADAANGIEIFRHQVIMDIAFADDFGFDTNLK